MVVRDVKEEEEVNRITKMVAKLHFSGDRSSILGMKVSADVTNWGTWMTTKRSWPPSLPRWTKTFSIPYKQNKLLLLYSCVLFNNQSCEHMFGHSPIKFFGLPAFCSSQMSLVLLPCKPRKSISRTRGLGSKTNWQKSGEQDAVRPISYIQLSSLLAKVVFSYLKRQAYDWGINTGMSRKIQNNSKQTILHLRLTLHFRAKWIQYHEHTGWCLLLA